MWRRYECPVEGCEYETRDVWSLAMHLDEHDEGAKEA